MRSGRQDGARGRRVNKAARNRRGVVGRRGVKLGGAQGGSVRDRSGRGPGERGRVLRDADGHRGRGRRVVSGIGWREGDGERVRARGQDGAEGG